MNSRQSLLLTALASFAGGFVAGVLMAPESRRRLAAGAQGSARWVGHQMHAIEAQLTALEHQLNTISADLGERVRATTKEAFDPHVPSIPDEEMWEFEGEDVARDLRRMPRK